MAAADPSLPVIERAKQISVYQNGDRKFPGKRLIINKRHIANFDVFLDHVTENLRPRFGAVRRLYTPVGGHRVTDLEQVIKRGEAYVAAGQEKFRSLRYWEIEIAPPKRLQRYSLEIKPVRHSRIKTSGRIRKTRTEPIIIFVHSNGNDLENPHRIQLRPREQGSWEMVLDAIKERVALRWGGAIRRLCTLDGRPLQSVHELEGSGCYVACGAEKFVRKDYENPKVVMTSPRQERRAFQHGTKLTPISNRNSKKGSQDSSVNRTPELNQGAVNTRPRKARRNQVKKEDQVIHEKPVAYKRNGKKDVNYDEDPGGVFKAHRENQATKGATEVREDGNTRVDVPVDQREAEVVEEEEDMYTSVHASLHDDHTSHHDDHASHHDDHTSHHDDHASLHDARSSHHDNRRRKTPKTHKCDGGDANSQRRVSFEGDLHARRMSHVAESREKSERRSSHHEQEFPREPDAMEEAPEGFEQDEGPHSKREETIKRSPSPEKKATEDERSDSPYNNAHDTPPQSPRQDSPVPTRESPPAEIPVNHNDKEEEQSDFEDVSHREVQRSTPPPENNDADENEARKSTPADDDNAQDRKPRDGQQQEHQSLRKESTSSPSPSEKENAAVSIQSHYRGYRSRKEQRESQGNRNSPRQESDAEYDPESEKAAIVIQSGYRGYRTRKELKQDSNNSL